MGRRSNVSKFPVARIKKIMQADEDVGKVAQATPVAVSKALEQFLNSLVTATISETVSSGSRKVSTSHLKRAIHSDEMFDFLKSKVENVPDVVEPERVPAASTSRRRSAAEGNLGRPRKRARASKKAKKEEDEDDDLVSADEDEDEEEQTYGRGGGAEEEEEEDDDEDYKPGHGGSVPIGNMIGNAIKAEEEPPALLPNFNGGGMITHSSNYIPPGGPVSSSSSSSRSISNIIPNFGDSSSRSILNPVEAPSAPAPAPAASAPSSSKGFASSSTFSSLGSKPGGLPPPRFAPGGSAKVKEED